MPENAPLTLAAGDHVSFVRRATREPGPVQYDIYVGQQGRSSNRVGTFSVDQPLVINGDASGAIISMPAQTFQPPTVAGQNPPPTELIPRLQINTTNPPLVDKGPFILTQESTQGVRVMGTPANVTGVNMPRLAAGQTLNADGLTAKKPEEMLQAGSAVNERMRPQLGANAGSMQVLTFRSQNGISFPMIVEGDGKGKGAKIEVINPNAPNGPPIFTLSGGTSLETNVASLTTEQTRVRGAIVTAVNGRDFAAQRALGVGAGGMGGMGQRPGVGTPDAGGNMGQRPGAPATQPATQPELVGGLKTKEVMATIARFENFKKGVAGNLASKNADFKAGLEAVSEAGKALQQGGGPTPEKLTAYQTAMDKLVATTEKLGRDKGVRPDVSAMARGMAAPLRDFKKVIDAAAPAKKAEPGAAEEKKPFNRGEPKPKEGAKDLTTTADEQIKVLEGIKSGTGIADKKKRAHVQDMFDNNPEFAKKFKAAQTALETMKQTPNEENQAAAAKAMDELITQTREVAKIAQKNKKPEKSKAASALAGDELFKVKQAVKEAVPGPTEGRKTGMAFPSPTDMMLAAARSSVDPMVGSNHPRVHLETGTSVVANGPGGAGGREIT